MKTIATFSVEASEELHRVSSLQYRELGRIQEKLKSQELFMLQQLLITCQFSSESAFILIGHDKVWDAEIIFRAILEGTVRALFLSIGDSGERQEKFHEFWSKVENKDTIKRSKKSQEMLRLIGKVNDPDFLDIKGAVMSNDEIDSLRSQIGKLKYDWDFNSLLRSIVSVNVDKYGTLIGLGWSYFNMSDLIHMGPTAVNVIRERNLRDDLDRESIHRGHSLRTMQDVLLLARLRGSIISHWGDNSNPPNPQSISDFEQSLNLEYQKVVNFRKNHQF